MSGLRMLFTQFRYLNKAFWRNPASAFFTFAFPLMFLVIFTSLLGHGKVNLDGHEEHLSTYYVAAMAAFAVITSCYNNISIALATQRESGVLQRTRGTPISAGIYIASRVLHAILIVVILVVITAGFGRAFYHADLPTGVALFRFVIVLVVGASSFCALGFALASFIPNAEAAPAVVNATILPLLFLSGIFIPLGSDAPSWILWVARIFPVRHFAVGMQSAFLGTTFHWSDVLIVAVWGIGGFIVAWRWFTWEPKT